MTNKEHEELLKYHVHESHKINESLSHTIYEGFRLRNHSRLVRKGRYPVIEGLSEKHLVKRKGLILASYEPSNVSWWVAWSFTFGSVLWVLNGSVLMWPLPSSQTSFGVAQISAFFGALVFEFGAYFAVLEAINPSKALEFGYYVKEKEHQVVLHLHGVQQKNFIRENWRWFAISFKNTGEQAAMVQMFGATLFMLSCTLSLPTSIQSETMIIPNSQYVLQDIFIWGSQVIGSFCFLYASVILVLETQLVWYRPNIYALGWHVNMWNVVGSLGFLFCAIFGLLGNVNGRTVCCQYWGTVFSTFWGSIGFLIGSMLLCTEIANKHPNPETVQEEESVNDEETQALITS